MGTEKIVPLTSDFMFFTILIAALESLSSQEPTLQLAFKTSLQNLAYSISQSARPVSFKSKFIKSTLSRNSNQDLNLWRQIFTTYMEMEIFESTVERDRGERDIPTAEKKFQFFVKRVTKDSLKLSVDSRQSLEAFLQLNVYILDLKKVRSPCSFHLAYLMP
jgi:hypothetical protein